jgi:hypothetical protein
VAPVISTRAGPTSPIRGAKNAPIERVEPDAAPPEPCDGQSDGRRDEVSQLLESRGSDSRDCVEIVDRAECSVLLSVVDDRLAKTAQPGGLGRSLYRKFLPLAS